jgi:hypothetical protein
MARFIEVAFDHRGVLVAQASWIPHVAFEFDKGVHEFRVSDLWAYVEWCERWMKKGGRS